MGILGPIRRIFSENLILPWIKTSGTVFCYHDVSNPSDPSHGEHVSTRIDRFLEQIDFLSTLFTWVPLEELQNSSSDLALSSTKRHRAALTFDDGFRSVLVNALPFLQKRKIPFTVYLCQGAIEIDTLPFASGQALLKADPSPLRTQYENLVNARRADEREALSVEQEDFLIANASCIRSITGAKNRVYLDVDDVRRLISAGGRLGNHSGHHRILSRCDEGRIRDEILGNQAYLKRQFDWDAKTFALPYGKNRHISSMVMEVLGEVGFASILMTELGHRPKSGLIWPRVSLLNETPSEILFKLNRSMVRRFSDETVSRRSL